MTRVLLDRNESPYSPAPRCLEVLRAMPLDRLTRYSRADPLGERLSAFLGVHRDRLVRGAGSEALLKTAFLSLLRRGQRVLLPEPSWSYYGDLAALAGAEVRPYALSEGRSSFAYDEESLLGQVEAARPSLVVLASPNNPTGNSLPRDVLIRVLEALPDASVLLDEAYWGYASTDSSVAGLTERFPNLIVLRTFSKFFGLPGIRLGFAVAGRGVRPFTAAAAVYLGHDRVSEEIALAALEDIDYYRDLAAKLEHEKRCFRALRGIPSLTCYDSDANFLLVRLEPEAFRRFRTWVDAADISVKVFPERRLSGYVRLTLGTPVQNQTLRAGLEYAGQPTVEASLCP